MFENRSLYIPYYECLTFTKWLIQNRDLLPQSKQVYQAPTNISILINSCMILEGFFYTLIKDQLFVAQYQIGADSKSIMKKNNPDLLNKLLMEFSNRLDGDSWSGYLRLFELFTDLKINADIKNWEAIRILFQFRNNLVHGNEMEFIFKIENDKTSIYASNPKMKSILNFCMKNNLVDIDETKKIVNLVTNKTADYFFKEMRLFAVEIFEMLPLSIRTKSSVDMFEFEKTSEGSY